MCDLCSELLDLLHTYELKSNCIETISVKKGDVATVCTYVQGWAQKQCTCCYKEAKLFEAFNNLIQNILRISLQFLNQLAEDLQNSGKTNFAQFIAKRELSIVELPIEKDNKSDKDGLNSESKAKCESAKEQVSSLHVRTMLESDEDEWSLDDNEKLLHFISKVFLLNFPLYVAYKHSVHSKMEEISQQEVAALGIYCDTNDPEIPVFLVRNVCFFCDQGGINAMTAAFHSASPETLPFSLAHAMIAVVSNLKLWMNIGTIVQCLVPLRTNVIRYMCKLSDKDLRVTGTRNMSEFMWTAVKDPLDAHLTFDREGLDLAFKYFTSSTLTMRLAGIAQINNHINMYTELCNSETFMETESVGLALANWLIQNKVIEHIFGPNLHVEIIKQSHYVLNFLATEGRITNDHIDCIWAAAQLKHCSKQVHDLLPPLIKNFEAHPALHLYCLLCKLEPKEHTEQTLCLASALIKFIWSSGGTPHGTMAMAEYPTSHSPFTAMLKGSINVSELEKVTLGTTAKRNVSSSEHSVSVEASNSDEEEPSDCQPVQNTSEPDSSQLSDKRASSNEGSEEGVKKRLQQLARKKKALHHRQKNRKRMISRREPGEIAEIDDSSASSAALDTDLSNVSNDSLPTDCEGVGDNSGLRVSGLSTMSETDDDSGNEDSSVDDKVQETRCKLYRHRQKLRSTHRIPEKTFLTGRGKAVQSKELDVDEMAAAKINLEENLKRASRVFSELTEDKEECYRGIQADLSIKDLLEENVNEKLVSKKLVAAEETENKTDDDSEVKKKAGENVKDIKQSQEVEKKPQPIEAKKGELDPSILEVESIVAKITNEKIDSGKTDEEVKNQNTGATPVFCESQEPEIASGEYPQLAEATENEIYDCREYLEHMHAQRHIHEPSDMVEDILSPDDGSCSSRISNKSEKNMADFDGEESGCDEELVQLTARTQSHLNSQQMHQHFNTMNSMYRSHVHQAKVFHRYGPKEQQFAAGHFDIEKVCKPGHTLLWDLIQDEIVGQLGEGLAAETEKTLCNLVCWSTDRLIRMKFIEGCLENLAINRSVVISLRLLPKLFGSFQQYRVGMDTHAITLWAEREHKMMTHFFNNLLTYTTIAKKMEIHSPLMCSHQTEIQVRLQFLTCVFSSMGSPDNFRLTLEQVDTLWSCLAFDQECSDELFSWLLNQAKNKDQHAMGLDTFKHIFLEKMPLLLPETTSMTALNLYQQLSSLTHLAASASDETSVSDLSGMDQLWGIALRAENTDVSMAAIQYLNSYYINIHHGTLEKEDEFIERCMNNLYTASLQLDEAEDSNLIIIQRGLLLLKTHLETFQRRYSYHLRLWYLDGCGIMRHQKSLAEKQATSLRIVCQPGGLSDKVTFEMLGSDYVAELRAEVTRWWEQLQRAQQQKRKSAETSTSAQECSETSSVMPPTEGPIRMISQGQELSADLDERTLQDMGFKDMQLVFVSVGAARPQRKREGLEPTSQLPAPPRFKLPMELLLQTSHFEQLFCLMQQLSSLKFVKNIGDWMPHTKGQLLSRRVWELLMMLPTCPTILQGFQSLVTKTVDKSNESSFENLIDPASPQKLMYCLQIVESLAKPSRSTTKTVCVGDGDNVNKESSDSKCEQDLSFTEEFIKQGGLRHIFGIFMSGVLQSSEVEDGNEWKQDCLAYLLKLINQFGIDPNELEVIREDVIDNYETPRKKTKKNKRGSNEKSLIPRLNSAMLELMEVEPVMNTLMHVLEEAATLKDPNFYKTGFWGRAQVVHYTIGLLVHWSFSCDAVKTAFFSRSTLAKLLKRLLLDDPEPEVRREACTGQYRLCLGTTIDGKSGQKYIAPLLSCLLSFLSDAQAMKCMRLEPEEDGKEPYGSACRDYFWLVCRLVDSLDDEIIKEFNEQQTTKLDFDNLIKYLVESILSRDFLETRHATVEDDGLVGLLTSCTAVMKHNPPFKFSQDGQAFLIQLFDCLFALPSPKQRFLPKCKSNSARSAAYDLIIEIVKNSIENYTILHKCLLKQHSPDSHSPYPWDYWPHEDGRSDCGYVGLTNLGATCYMASCMQHLYMMPQARVSILAAKQCNEESKHENTLHELQRMFAYLLESERKAYNPKSFCKVYVMDHQPLNTGEQKDMAEFFTDLISKLEEMTPQLKELVKTLFCGVITNNVVSLDCPHVSRTIEEFYTVRCQVADMRNLYESLDEVTVKDTLEGDNMYTCSQCGKKVRAEKRACFKKLPKIICFNTMRYTFNMVTMMKEKVNTHFSFPLRLDMSGYIEKNLMPDQYKVDDCSKDEEDNYLYDLIGVTVHTGTADGGHYYSFIRDRTSLNKDKWFLFNDAEVKPFDPAQIAAECFGGEMTVKFSKTYDSVTDKFMDFSFEKTNSAYMLFYERSVPNISDVKGELKTLRSTDSSKTDQPHFELSKELAEWIWQDNMQFLQDKNIFEHTYFNFMWQICGYIPQTMAQPKDVTLMSSKLSTSFVLETLIHAKEKPTMVQWIELLTKQCNSSQSACEWFMDHMAENDWWPVQILIKCPNQVVRQMFQRLCIHVINKLKPVHSALYLQPYVDSDDSSDVDIAQIGRYSCVTRFIRKLLSLIEHGAKQHCKHLTEYFTFLLEFAKMGEEESQFLIATEAIAIMVNFYLGQKSSEYIDVVSDEDDDDDDDVISIVDDKYKPASLEKMITLIATLAEKSRGDDHRLQLSENDLSAVAGGKGFPFLFQQIRDNINIRQTCNLIFSLCRWNDRLGAHIITMIFQAITKHNELNQPFFKLLSLLVEFVGGPPGMPSFTNLILQRIWEVAEYCPQQCLEWLAMQVPRNKVAHSWVLANMESWVEHFLIAHVNQRVRHAAAVLLVNLVPSNSFRQAYRTARTMLSPQKEITMNAESVMILHQIYDLLLRLLKRAKHFVDPAQHGTTKLMSYFALMTYCLVSRTERLMFGQYFLDLWQLFQPKLSEPPISVHHNKQALLIFWYQVCIDCPENVKLIVQNAHVTKNIAFNYILADHDDQDVMVFNRCMLPAYYGLLRLCCQQSRVFTRQLANHQNIQWAFKNITPYTTQYSAAIDELFKLMRLFVLKYPDSTEQELKDIHTFKRMTLQLYLGILDARSCWTTLITACRILLETNDDRLFLLYNNGLPMMFEAFLTLHVMYHEATACHVVGDLVELLSIVSEILKCARVFRETKEVKHCLLNWKDRVEAAKKLITLLNSYTPNELRLLCIDILRELIMLYPGEILQTLVPLLTHCHATFQENNVAVTFGPYFPKQGQKLIISKSNIRPQRPMFQMFLHPSQIEVPKGLEEDYDQNLLDFFFPYHQLVDMLCRMAINHDLVTDGLVSLSAMVGFEGIPMHLGLFPKLWLDIYQAEHIDKKYIEMLCTSNYLVDYLEAVLLDEQPSLNNPVIYQFCSIFFPKVYHQVVNEQLKQQVNNFMSSFPLNIDPKDLHKAAYKINGELRVLVIVLSTNSNQTVEESFVEGLRQLQQLCDVCLKRGLHQEEISESQDAPNTEKPAKRRKISETSTESATLSVCTEPELSQEGSSKSLVIGGTSAKTDNPNWIELLSQTISHLLVRIQELNKMST
uniref:ubiquitinyl hydrolase 1 n=1 Tax=Strigamia maritima TaxID=126957 RepID=T1IPZ0_STRMM